MSVIVTKTSRRLSTSTFVLPSGVTSSGGGTSGGGGDATLNENYAYLPGKLGGQTLKGGTAVGDQLILQGTTGVGTAGVKAVLFKVGDNGATESLSIQNNGVINIPAAVYIDYGNGVRFNTPTTNYFTFSINSGTNDIIYLDNIGLHLDVLGNPVILENADLQASTIYYDTLYGATIYGGQAVGSTLSLISTLANGTSATNAILFKVGNNGAITAGYIKNTGVFYIPTLNHENGFYWQSTAEETGNLFLTSTDGVIFDYMSSSGISLGMSTSVTGAVTATTFMTMGTYAGSPSFTSGFAGSGWRMALESGDANLTVDNLWVRKRMSVYELVINQIRATNGSVWISDCAKVTSVTDLGLGNWRCYIDTDSANIVQPFAYQDIIRCQKWTGRNVKYYTAIVTAISGGGDYFNVFIIDGTDAPEIGDDVVRVGNTTDTARQGSIYLTASDSNAPFIDIMDGVDDESFAGKTKVRLGKLTGITDAIFGALSGYGLYSSNVYLTGSVVANAGLIAGFTIDSTEGLYAGTGTTRVQMKPGAGFWAGATAIGDAPFSVSAAGALTATSGLIAGWTINSAYIAKDTGTDATSSGMAHADYPFYAGATYANRASAQFRVTNAGSMTAVTGLISGFTFNGIDGLYAGSGTSRVQMKHDAGFWCGATVQTSAPFYVTQAGKLFCTSLDIKTAATGQRIEMNSTTNELILYASNGVDYAKLTTDSDVPVIEATWSPSGSDYIATLSAGYLLLKEQSSLGGNAIRMSVRPQEYSEFSIDNLNDTTTLGGSGWKQLWWNINTGDIAYLP